MMKAGYLFPVCIAAILLSGGVAAQSDDTSRAEIKLIDPLDDKRGWCVDMFAHLTNALPLGGLQGHNCFLYMGNGPTEDQGFLTDLIRDEGEFRFWYWDMCMTLHDPNPGSFVAVEECTGSDVQRFDMTTEGRIIARAAPDLCLTLGPTTIPGGGRRAPADRVIKNNDTIPQIRRLTFETCDDENGVLQKWELRDEYQESEITAERRFK